MSMPEMWMERRTPEFDYFIQDDFADVKTVFLIARRLPPSDVRTVCDLFSHKTLYYWSKTHGHFVGGTPCR